MKFRKDLQIKDRQRKRRIKPKLASFRDHTSSACLVNYKLAADKLPRVRDRDSLPILPDEGREGTSAHNRAILYRACAS